MDGMSDGDKFHVIAIIANRLSRDMSKNVAEMMTRIDSEGTMTAEKFKTALTVAQLETYAEGLQMGVQILDFAANPDRYVVTQRDDPE